MSPSTSTQVGPTPTNTYGSKTTASTTTTKEPSKLSGVWSWLVAEVTTPAPAKTSTTGVDVNAILAAQSVKKPTSPVVYIAAGLAVVVVIVVLVIILKNK